MFSDGSKIAEDNANLYWDNMNKRLGIGTTSPQTKVDINGNLGIGGVEVIDSLRNLKNILISFD